ncbi:hypothetical protein HQN89_20240 [Paenibacillus frigoriresistens]|uniref:P-loop NTPase fold protein n=1 Tax=Paenibacillus alginolyticus TaxID=59839 RepID=UPI001565667E|nr:P-loop NTPase fold protein [Paenibacillus frigoriresistens]NRF93304.1 hypothetical protein [Paenibacillus frigoriresistens]
MANLEETCTTMLLSDDPVDEDGFGGHQRLAGSIFNMISKEKVGKSIAIRGSWGSGKSTIIKLIRKLAGESQESNIKVIVFDAWEHEGDSLRRTFLEFLLSALDDVKWIKATDWETLKQNLSRKRNSKKLHQYHSFLKVGSIWLVLL